MKEESIVRNSDILVDLDIVKAFENPIGTN